MSLIPVAAVPRRAPVSGLDALPKNVVVSCIIPFLFQREKNQREGSYFDGNKRAIFIASRNFARYEDHVLQMHPDYFGQALLRSGFLERSDAQQNRHFRALFKKKINTCNHDALSAPQPRLRRKFERELQQKERAERIVEGRLFFTAVEFKNSVQYLALFTGSQTEQLLRSFPLLQEVTLTGYKINAAAIDKLQQGQHLQSVRINRCLVPDYRKEPRKMEQAINKLQRVRQLHIEGSCQNLNLDTLHLKLPVLQRLTLPRSTFVDITANIQCPLLEELCLEAGSYQYHSPEPQFPLLRRCHFALWDSFSFANLNTFFRHHSFVDEVSILCTQSPTSHFIQALLRHMEPIKSLKKFSLWYEGGTMADAEYDDLMPLMLKHKNLRELDLGVSYRHYREQMTDLQELLTSTPSVQKLTLRRVITPLEGLEAGLPPLPFLRGLVQPFHNIEELVLKQRFITAIDILLLPWMTQLKKFSYEGKLTVEAWALLHFMRSPVYSAPSFDAAAVFDGANEDLKAYAAEIADRMKSETELDIDVLSEFAYICLNDRVVVTALQARPNLKNLNLWGACNCTEGAVDLMPELLHLEHANLLNCGISLNGLAGFVGKCPNLTELLCTLKNRGDMAALGRAISQHQKLKKLFIASSENITFYGLKLLLGENRTLESLDLSAIQVVYNRGERFRDLVEFISKLPLRELRLSQPQGESASAFEEATKYLLQVMPQLEVYVQHGAQLTVSIAQELALLPKLQHVHLSGGVTPRAELLVNLLDMRHKIDLLSAKPPLFGLGETFLDFHQFPLQDLESFTEETYVRALRCRPFLRAIDFSRMKRFGDKALDVVQELSELENIIISETSVTVDGLTKLFENNQGLKKVAISFQPGIERALAALRYVERLEWLVIEGSEHSVLSKEAAIAIVAGQPNLKYLKLPHMVLGEGVLPILVQLQSLVELHLPAARPIGEAYDELMAFTHPALRMLDISHFQFLPSFDHSRLDDPIENYPKTFRTKEQFVANFRKNMPRCSIVDSPFIAAH